MCENRLGDIFSHLLPKWRDHGELSDLCSIWMSATENSVYLFQISHENLSITRFLYESYLGCLRLKTIITPDLSTCRLINDFSCHEGVKPIVDLCVKTLAINFVSICFKI